MYSVMGFPCIFQLLSVSTAGSLAKSKSQATILDSQIICIVSSSSSDMMPSMCQVCSRENFSLYKSSETPQITGLLITVGQCSVPGIAIGSRHCRTLRRNGGSTLVISGPDDKSPASVCPRATGVATLRVERCVQFSNDRSVAKAQNLGAGNGS